MSREEYQVKIDGEEMNISKAIRYNKAKIGWAKFYKLKDRFGIEKWEVNNNIIKFKLNDNEYYFTLVKWKIRRVGQKDWTGKIIEFLTNENK